MNTGKRLVFGIAAILLAVALFSPKNKPRLLRFPQPTPSPKRPTPLPRKPNYQWSYAAKVGGPNHEDGTSISCDLPGDFHMKNVGGSDGAGLCVFTSINHSAWWQHILQLRDFQEWMKKHPGGGYPEKVKKMITQICQEKGVPEPEYIQVEGGDLEILKLACQNGLMPGVTYSYSPTGRYGGHKISHMVSLVHADDHHFVILDNNYPGENAYEWLTPEEFRKTYTGGGGGWAVIPLHPGPPLPPSNGGSSYEEGDYPAGDSIDPMLAVRVAGRSRMARSR